MKTKLPMPRSGREFPSDLRSRVPAVRLLHWVLEVVSQLGADRPGREFRHGGAGYNHNQLLAILGYAYLCGIYGSEELEEQVECDPVLKYLAAGATPKATVFRHFRRRHRGPLGVVLLRVLARCASETPPLPPAPVAWLDTPTPQSPAAGIPDPDLLHRCAVEAEARLARAVLADMAALDV